MITITHLHEVLVCPLHISAFIQLKNKNSASVHTTVIAFPDGMPLIRGFCQKLILLSLQAYLLLTLKLVLQASE